MRENGRCNREMVCLYRNGKIIYCISSRVDKEEEMVYVGRGKYRTTTIKI